MTSLLAPGRLLELVMAGVVVEGLLLVAYRRRTGRGMPAREVVAFLGAGLALLGAARATVAASATPGQTLAIAAAMAAALACHVWHVVQRWDA